MDQLTAKVTETSEAYNAAVSEQARIAAEIEELNGEIAEIEKELPIQKLRSDTSLRALYKYSWDNTSVINILLGSKDITEALSLLDSYNWIIQQNINQVEKTEKMERTLKSNRKKLKTDKAEADKQANEAANALASAKAARQKAQEEAAARQKAEAEAAAKAAAEAQASATTKEAKKAAAKEAKQETANSASVSTGNVDWSADKTAFVNTWAPRINAYLAGSPTAGTGQTYASAAWDYGVDPRWAPAISCVESGKGSVCFRSHNAWGFGGSGFGSWDEGIRKVVSSLGGSLYGGYLTKAAAKTYCPPNWEHWYNRCAEEMAKI